MPVLAAVVVLVVVAGLLLPLSDSLTGHHQTLQRSEKTIISIFLVDGTTTTPTPINNDRLMRVSLLTVVALVIVLVSLPVLSFLLSLFPSAVLLTGVVVVVVGCCCWLLLLLLFVVVVGGCCWLLLSFILTATYCYCCCCCRCRPRPIGPQRCSQG